jgi:hypothetical protein
VAVESGSLTEVEHLILHGIRDSCGSGMPG